MQESFPPELRIFLLSLCNISVYSTRFNLLVQSGWTESEADNEANLQRSLRICPAVGVDGRVEMV